MIKGVVFDMDGLMFDTERLVKEAWRETGREMGYLVPDELLFRTLGLNVENTRRVFLQYMGEDFDFYSLRSMRVEYVTDHIEKYGIPKKPGLMELLDYLKNHRYKIAAATSTEREKTEYYFQKAGVRPYFDGIVCGDMIERGKPEPDIYLKACGLLGLAPDACVALEDSPYGILSAYRAGMKPVMIPDLLEPDEETRKMLCAELPSLADVVGLLNSMD